MRRGQPAVHREHTGLYAEAHDHGERAPAHEALMAGHRFGGQNAARGEGHCRAVARIEEYTQQRQRRAEHGIEQILDARGDRLFAHCVQHERQRHERHQLIEHIHRDQIAAEAQADQHAQRDQIEQIEAAFVFLALHIVERIEAHAQPHTGDEQRKQLRNAVHMEIDRHRVGQLPQRQLLRAAQHGQQHQQRVDHEGRARQRVAGGAALYAPGQQSGKHRHDDGQYQQDVIPHNHKT